MPVHGSNPELPHVPGLVAKFLDDDDTLRDESLVKLIDLIDLQVREVRVIAQLVGIDRVPALSGHDETLVPDEEAPSRIADLSHFEPQDIPVVASRTLQIEHGDDVSGISDHRILFYTFFGLSNGWAGGS